MPGETGLLGSCHVALLFLILLQLLCFLYVSPCVQLACPLFTILTPSL